MEFKIVFAGCGDIAFRWLDHITKRDDCEIVAVADKNPQRFERWAKKYKLNCPVYTSVDEAIEKAKGNLLIDLTYVTTHRDVVISALKAGYNVFGEKPMAFDEEQANDMLRAVRQTGKRYIIMQNRRYIDQVKKIKEMVASGIMGQPSYLCSEIFVNADLNSIRNQLEYPQLQDNNVHAFDQARFMLSGNPKSVYYHSFNPKGSQYIGDAASDAIFEFDNGSVFSFRGYTGVEGCFTSWNNVWRINCERGSIIWDGENDVHYEYTKEAGSIFKGIPYISGTIKKPEICRDQHDIALEDFFDALKTGKPIGSDCGENIHSIAMVFASIKSIKEKRKVEIEINEEYPYIVLK